MKHSPFVFQLSTFNFQLLSFVFCLSTFVFSLPSFSQTQSGYVRTVSRPGQPSLRLQGVVVRVQGDYNPVMTDEQGGFQVLMPGYKAGTAYSLAGANKGGYELQEPELVGRQLPFSASVPLEIIMVSRRQMQKDKQRIEQAARENVERYYEQQLNALNDRLAQAQLTNQQYEAQLQLLEERYDSYEPLIEQMAERYARTDYTALSQTDSLIQQAIEQGDLDLAQQRILAKGDPSLREQKIQRIRRLADAQRDELAGDLYHLYAIHLSRFRNDSALLYITRRAALDTTNAQWQLDAGNAYDKMGRDYAQALTLYRRALRYALADEGPQALRTAQAHNNIAYALTRLARYDEALPEQRQALALYRHIYGTNHALTAARIVNLGAIHYYSGQRDSAQLCFTRAEEVYTALESAEPDNTDIPLLHAQLLNNQAAIDVAGDDYTSAYNRLSKALTLLPASGAEYDKVVYLRALGAVCHYRNMPAEAHSAWQQAYDIALRIYGPEHPVTLELGSYLQ